MNDQFLNSLRQEPAPAFARQLRSRLRALDAPVAKPRSPMWRWLATAASIGALAFAFTFPAVRSAAEAFLDYFRVVNFAGVAFDPQRMAQLWSSSSIDLSTLIGQQVTPPPAPPPPPVAYATLDEASAAAGMSLHTPTWLPQGFTLMSIEVGAEHDFSVQGDIAKLQTVLDALAITDVTVPAGLDGQTVSIQIPPVAKLVYSDGQHQITLTQSKSPVVALPAGVDIASLAEIGLRLLGLDRTEAYNFAQSIDWRSTLLVPVPAATATFHQVEVGSGSGLVIESGPQVGQGLSGPGGSLVLWSNADTVYALGGQARSTDTLQMAQSVQ